MEAIVICTVKNAGITVLLESIRIYEPAIPVYICGNNLGDLAKFRRISPNLIWFPNTATNFGDAYNHAVSYAFKHGKFDSLILSNDDVVLNPSTLALLREDKQILEENGQKIGFLGARSDYVLPDQNIRFEGGGRDGVRWSHENFIKETQVIAPIFATITREAWDTAKFPSTNWYSDNIICHDLQKAGFRHFVSRAYVHHAGSQTVGMDYQKCHEEPREWIKAHRPDMYDVIYA